MSGKLVSGGLVAAVTFTLTLAAAGAGHAEAAVFQTGFEDPPFEAGQSIDGVGGWASAASNVTAQAQTGVVFAGDQALGVTTASNAAASQVTLDAAGQAGAITGDVTVALRLRIDAVTGSNDTRELLLTIGNESGETIATIIFERDNGDAAGSRDITVRHGFSSTIVGQWTAGAWMDLQVLVDTDADTFNLSIGGTPQFVAAQALQSNRAADAVAGLAFGHAAWTGATYYVDDLSIVPEPASIALALLGGVALATRRR